MIIIVNNEVKKRGILKAGRRVWAYEFLSLITLTSTTKIPTPCNVPALSSTMFFFLNLDNTLRILG